MVVLGGIEYKPYPEHQDLFSVSSCGKVVSKRGKTLRVLKQVKLSTGYLSIATKIGGRGGKAKCFRVHRMVAETWLEEPTDTLREEAEKTVYGKVLVNHLDGDKLNNHLDNLEWTCYSGNTAHAIKAGLHTSSSRKEHWLLCLQQDIEVIALWVNRYKPRCRTDGARAISREYGVTHEVVTNSVTKYKEFFPEGH